MRSELEVAKNCIKIINNAYNASPASTEAVIALLKASSCKCKRVAIIGDMIELGAAEIHYHETVLQHCIEVQSDVVALAGRWFMLAANNMNLWIKIKTLHEYDAENLANEVIKLSDFFENLVYGNELPIYDMV